MMTVPVTITLDGPDTAPVVLEPDIPGRLELTPAQARAIADDLYAMADEAEG